MSGRTNFAAAAAFSPPYSFSSHSLSLCLSPPAGVRYEQGSQSEAELRNPGRQADFPLFSDSLPIIRVPSWKLEQKWADGDLGNMTLREAQVRKSPVDGMRQLASRPVKNHAIASSSSFPLFRGISSLSVTQTACQAMKSWALFTTS